MPLPPLYHHTQDCASGRVEYPVAFREPEEVLQQAMYNSGPAYWSLPSTSDVQVDMLPPRLGSALEARWAALEKRFARAFLNAGVAGSSRFMRQILEGDMK